MKIRTGFVSNSSSASFTLITTAEGLKAVLEQFTVQERKFLKSVLGPRRKGKIFGKDILNYSNDYHSENMAESFEKFMGASLEEEEAYELFDKFMNSFKDREDSFADLMGY